MGAINPDQQSVRVRQRELIAEEDVTNTAEVAVEDLMENRVASRTPFKRLWGDADAKTEQQEYGVWMEYVLTVMRVTRTAFMEECLPAGRTKDQAVKHGRFSLEILSESCFDRGKQQ